jgi:adenine-specific DNA-methyltransferase
LYGPDENRIIQIKVYLEEYQDVLRSIITLDGRLGAYALNSLFGRGVDTFENPKPPQLIGRLLSFIGKQDSIVIDYFAGSGTTVEACIEAKRRSHRRQRYVAVEVSQYFDTVMLSRIKKLIYSNEWAKGKPSRQGGISHMLKYLRLESYEDALHNIEFKRTEAQQQLLDTSKELKESYTLSYMLDAESKDSPSLLNISAFEDPFNYKLKVGTGSVGETKLVNVDVVETFNYLIGLTVKHIDWIRGFCVVEGTDPKNEKVLVIWRNVKEKTNEDLEAFFNTLDIRTKDREFDLIYVNGDNNLENIRREDETWKVRMIEEDFFRLMFEAEDN